MRPRIIFQELRSHYILLSFVAGYIVSMSYYTIMRYETFQTNAFDFGIFNQLFWSTVHGRLFYETPDMARMPSSSGNFLGVHFSPLLFLLVPVYYLYQSPYTLLITQTVFIALGSIPVYMISKLRFSKSESTAIALVYLFNPFISALNIADFHVESFLPIFLFFAYYYLTTRRWNRYGLFLVLSLVTIDFAPVLVFFMLTTYLLQNRSEVISVLKSQKPSTDVLIVMSSMLLSVAYFIIAIQASLWIAGGTTTSIQVDLQGFFVTSNHYLLTGIFWLLMFSVFLFVPLLSFLDLLMIVPWFFVSWVGFSTFVEPGYQYAGAFVVPFLMLGFIRGMSRLDTRLRRQLLVSVVFMMLILTPFNPATQNRLTGIAYEQGYPIPSSHTDVLDSAIKLIPNNASVYTQNNLFPQVSNRFDAYVYLDPGMYPDFVLADTTDITFYQQIQGPSNPTIGVADQTQCMCQVLPKFLANSSYGIKVWDDGVVVLQRNYRGPILLLDEANYIYNYTQLAVYSGEKVYDNSSFSGFVAYTSNSQQDVTFWTGPRVNLPPGTYDATFRIKSLESGNITLDVIHFVNATNTVELSRFRVSSLQNGMWQNVTIRFGLSRRDATVGLLGFRGLQVTGTWYLDYIEVNYVGA